MNPFQEKVRAFHKAMKHPAPERPFDLEAYRGELRHDLLAEEVEEFYLAWQVRDQVKMIDALCDILYVTCGAAVEMGVDLEPHFNEVHRSNMDKAGGPTSPSGKQLKPPGWKGPDLQSILDQQRKAK